ncbi:MAG: hypothetical protein M3138_09715, partial [Actinomycetota bacterium]|nr:hypothetical protein [Actinomycetota bacterium]
MALRVAAGSLVALAAVLPAIAHPLTEMVDDLTGPLVVDGQPAPAPPPAGPPVPCDSLDIGYNDWVELAVPGGGLAAMGNFAQSPCTFVGAGHDRRVYLSRDAGRTWDAVLDLGEDRTMHGIVTEDAPAGTAFVLSSAGAGENLGSSSPGLHVTRDFGRSFEPVTDLEGYGITALAVAPGDPQVMYAVGGRELPLPAAEGIIFTSNDFGNSWTPLSGGLPIAPSRLAVDPFDPNAVWANSHDGVRT